jgi:hypothetical protein
MEPVVVYHFMLCRRASYDLGDPVAPYSLHNVVFELRPAVGSGVASPGTDLWVFVRLEGEGEQEFWIEVFCQTEDDEDEWEELLAAYGPYVVPFGSDRRTLSRAWHLLCVPLHLTGIYQFRFLHGGELLAVETIRVEW